MSGDDRVGTPGPAHPAPSPHDTATGKATPALRITTSAQADRLLDDYRRAQAAEGHYRDRAHDLEGRGGREETDAAAGTEPMALAALHEAADAAMSSADAAAATLLRHMLTTGELPAALTAPQPALRLDLTPAVVRDNELECHPAIYEGVTDADLERAIKLHDTVVLPYNRLLAAFAELCCDVANEAILIRDRRLLPGADTTATQGDPYEPEAGSDD